MSGRRMFLLSAVLAVSVSPTEPRHSDVSLDRVRAALQSADQVRPSLLLTAERERRILERMNRDPFFKAASAAIVREADRLVDLPPVERVLTGRRLVSVSRQCLHRVVWLGTAYYLHAAGPGGLYFNYSDCGSGGNVDPTVFWFAHRYRKPYLLHRQLEMLRPDGVAGVAMPPHRFAPLIMLWGDSEAAVPPQRNWMGRGPTPVAMFRSSWTDPEAAYLGLKGGTPGANHGHMDIGSFIYEADGVRWALDLGLQSYHAMEARGLRIWDRSQDSDRWRIFRYNNFSHNTLVVDGRLQNVDGFGELIRFSDDAAKPHAVVDMSDVYRGQLQRAVRGVALLPDRRALIQDEWEAGAEPAAVRWGMVAPGSLEILSPTTARLTEKGRTLLLAVHGLPQTRLRTYSTDPPAEWDEPNPNTTIIGFEGFLQPREEIRLAVVLTPGSGVEETEIPTLTPLLEWSPPPSW